MISIVTFKWKNPKTGYKLKNPVEYSAEHVNVLNNSIKRNTTLPFRFICVTDDPTDIDKDIEIIPLWNKCIDLGGCYNRLFMFSKQMKTILGDRFLTIDLDSVIVGNIDHILNRKEDFVINTFESKDNSWEQIYNGALMLMNAGSRNQVWEEFDFQKSPAIMDEFKNQKKLIGSDQAWIQFELGTGEARFTNADGVYDWSFLGKDKQLPDNASIVFLHGKRDPQIEKNNVSWVKENWRL